MAILVHPARRRDRRHRINTFRPLDRRDPKRQEALSPQSDLWDLPDVLISPNNAAASARCMHDFAAMVAEH